MSETGFQQLTYEVADRVATITLDRPEKLNAFTSRMVHEMVGALDRADADANVRAVIVTGAGRAFCAGADMSEGASTFEKTSGADIDPENPLRGRDGGGIVSLRLYQSLKPVIAAVNGPAVGVGVTMTLPMDIRMCSSDARFGFVFPQRGIVLEAASSWFLSRVVGMGQAQEWALTGRIFDADEALAGGLVRSVHEPDALLPAARTLAAEIAQGTSAISVAMNRQLLWRMAGERHPMAAHRIESRAVPQMARGVDGAEGVTSFLEKRPPDFRGDPATDMPDVFPWFSDPDFE